MAGGKIKVTRDKLAQFIPDHETIKYVENLFKSVDDIESNVVSELTNAAETAITKANEALALVEAIKFWKRTAGVLSTYNSGDEVEIDGDVRLNAITTHAALRDTTSTLTTSTTLTHTVTYAEQTTSGITTTLWASPNTGDCIRIRNRSGGSCTISGNGNNIEGAATQTIYDDEDFDLVFNGTLWII